MALVAPSQSTFHSISSRSLSAKKSFWKKKNQKTPKVKAPTVNFQGNDHDSSPCFTNISFVLLHHAFYLHLRLLIPLTLPFHWLQLVTCPDQGVSLYISLLLTGRHLVVGNLLNSNIISFSLFHTDNFPDVCRSLQGWIAFIFWCYYFYSLNTLRAVSDKFNMKQETGFVKLWHCYWITPLIQDLFFSYSKAWTKCSFCLPVQEYEMQCVNMPLNRVWTGFL